MDKRRRSKRTEERVSDAKLMFSKVTCEPKLIQLQAKTSQELLVIC